VKTIKQLAQVFLFAAYAILMIKDVKRGEITMAKRKHKKKKTYLSPKEIQAKLMRLPAH
jgi:hypothetical protein